MNKEQFDRALSNAERGDAIVYHRGLLMADRCRDDEANAVGWRAWRAWEAGLVLLFQHRKGDVCEYRAVRT